MNAPLTKISLTAENAECTVEYTLDPAGGLVKIDKNFRSIMFAVEHEPVACLYYVLQYGQEAISCSAAHTLFRIDKNASGLDASLTRYLHDLHTWLNLPVGQGMADL